MNKHKRYDSSIRGKYRHGKARAKKLGVEWALDLDEYKALILGGVCHYCSKPLNTHGSSLDRKDNKIGYTVKNCVPACWSCNNFKSNFLNYQEMRMITALLRVYRDGADD